MPHGYKGWTNWGIYDESLFSSSDNEIDDLYNELYESLLKVKKKLKQVNNKIESLNDQIKLIERENSILGIMIEQPLIENKIYN